MQNETANPETTDGDPCKCPHCGGNIAVNLIARARAESRMVFKVAPAPGELLTAKNLGGAISAFGGLMKSLGKDLKHPHRGSRRAPGNGARRRK